MDKLSDNHVKKEVGRYFKSAQKYSLTFLSNKMLYIGVVFF